MKTLITGASGFIGSKVAENLMLLYTTDSDDLYLTDWEDPGYPLRDPVQFINVDIADDAEICNLPFPFDVVVHCAGVLGTDTLFSGIRNAEEINVIGTLNVLFHQRPIRSTSSACRVLQPGLLGDWLSPYMISKKAAERYGLMYRQYLNINYTSVRLTEIYGPGQSSQQKKITPTFVRAALQDRDIPIYGDGSYRVRMMYVDDVALVLARMATKNYVFEPIVDISTLHSENVMSVLDFAKLIISMTNSKSKIVHLPMRWGQPPESEYPGTNPDTAQTGRIFDLLEITETPLQAGLTETINYYKEML